MEAPAKQPVIIYTESTPNPESLKFVTNCRMTENIVADFKDPQEAELWSPLAADLYKLPFVKSVYINNNFVTLTKEFNYDWHEVLIEAKNRIKSFLESGQPVLEAGYAEHIKSIASAHEAALFDGPDGEIAARIKELIDTYVKPAVESDGGNIEFKGYKDGVVYVIMQGSCSGCPSSTVTLKNGIEGMLQRMVPEVKEVVQEMG